jgi:hypothetical protein
MRFSDILKEQEDISALAEEIVKLGPEIAQAIIALLKPKN